MQEIKSKRTLLSKAFKNNDKFIIKSFNKPIHYDNFLKFGDMKSGLRQIDKNFIQNNANFIINFANDTLLAPLNSNDDFIYSDNFNKRETKIKLNFGGNSFGKIEYIDIPYYKGNTLIYDSIQNGIDLIFIPLRSKYLKLFRINNLIHSEGVKIKFEIEFDYQNKFKIFRKRTNSDFYELNLNQINKEFDDFTKDFIISDSINTHGTTIKSPKIWTDNDTFYYIKSRIYQENTKLYFEKIIPKELIDSNKLYSYTDLEIAYYTDNQEASLQNRAISGSFGSNSAWNNVRQYTQSQQPTLISSTSLANIGNTINLSFFYPKTSNSESPRLIRSFLPMNTDSINENDTILSGKLYFYPSVVTKTTTQNATFAKLALASSDRVTSNEVTANDWNTSYQLNNPDLISDELTISSLLTNEYNSFDLNQLGLDLINKNGTTDFIVIDKRDYTNTYNSESNTLDLVTIYSSEELDLEKVPYLELEISSDPNIFSKINDVNYSNILKVNKLELANIDKINGI